MKSKKSQATVIQHIVDYKEDEYDEVAKSEREKHLNNASSLIMQGLRSLEEHKLYTTLDERKLIIEGENRMEVYDRMITAYKESIGFDSRNHSLFEILTALEQNGMSDEVKEFLKLVSIVKMMNRRAGAYLQYKYVCGFPDYKVNEKMRFQLKSEFETTRDQAHFLIGCMHSIKEKGTLPTIAA